MKMFRKDEGFTLVELMVVVLIIGILVAIAVPVFLNASAAAKLKSCQANQRIIEGGIQTFNASLAGTQTVISAAGLVSGSPAANSPAQIVGNAVKVAPVCPGTGGGVYSVDDAQKVDGDDGTLGGPFIDGHTHY